MYSGLDEETPFRSGVFQFTRSDFSSTHSRRASLLAPEDQLQ